MSIHYGIDNGVLCASNVNFNPSSGINNGTMTSNGQLLIGSTGSPNIQVGTLTSPDGTVTIGYSTPNITLSAAGAAVISLRPYIVGATNSDYTTIQAAINQAVSDGASSSTPAMVYVKPGSYSENLTLADGVFITGFDPGSLINGDDTKKSVNITGAISFSSGISKLINVHLTLNNPNFITQSGGTLFLENISADVSSSVLVNFTTATTKTLYITSCNFVGDAFSSFLTNDTSTTTCKVVVFNSYVKFLGAETAILDTGASWLFIFQNSQIRTSFDFSVLDTVFVEFDNCYQEAVTSFELMRTSSTSASLTYNNCTMQPSGTPFQIGATTNFQITNSYINTSYANVLASFGDMEPSNFMVQEGFVTRGQLSGFSRTYVLYGQAAVQTTDATQTAVFSLAVPTGRAINIDGSFTATKSDYTEAAGGVYSSAYKRAVLSLSQVGSPIVNYQKDNASWDFTLDANSNNIRVLVTGVAATTINWVINYKIQPLEGST